jgi:hypothetical protein
MPKKIVMQEAQFAFLRKLLWDAAHGEVSLTPGDMDLARELYVILNYSRVFKTFTVEIEKPS